METEAEVKEIIQNYVLITYDIPAKETKTRSLFLKEARAIGAIGYTQSCYLLPYSEKAFELANKLALIGDAIVWKSRQEDKAKALAITYKYEDHLHLRCDYIRQRLVIGMEHIAAGRLGKANQMGRKTGELLAQLAQIAENFYHEWLNEELKELVADWKVVYE